MWLLLFNLLFARAETNRTVLFKWQAVPFAHDYEVEIGGKDGVVHHQFYPANDTYFETQLQPGAYFFHVRARDIDSRAGKWAESKAFFVPSDSPNPYDPPDGTEIEMFTKSKDVNLMWKLLPEVDGYYLELKKEPLHSTKQKTIFQGHVKDAEFLAKNLGPGLYTWSVAPVYHKKHLEAFGVDVPEWKGKMTKLSTFAIVGKKLPAPVGLTPEGKTPKTPGQDTLELSWRPVDGAEAYEVYIEDEDGKAVEAVVPTTAVLLPGVDDGDYNFSVRALASKDILHPAQVKSAESEVSFEYGKRFLKEERGNMKFSYFENSFSYKYPATSTLAAQTKKDRKPIFRLSGEFWFNTPLGLTWAIEEQLIKTSNYDGGTESVEFGFRYLFSGNPGKKERRNWLIAARTGVQNSKMLELIPSTDTTSILNTWGPFLGVDVRKYFFEYFSAGLNLQYFYPVGFFGDGGGRNLLSSSSTNNIRGSFDLGWTFAYHWEANLGARLEQRFLKYTPSAGYPTPGEIGYTSLAGFLSVAYSFGR